MYQPSIDRNNSGNRSDFNFSEVEGSEPLLTGNLYFSADKKWCYQLGVIDYLQVYNF